MNCECGTRFRNTGKGYVKDGILHRNVQCDKERGGCGNNMWYNKPVPLHPADRGEITVEGKVMIPVPMNNVTMIKSSHRVKERMWPPKGMIKNEEVNLDDIR